MISLNDENQPVSAIRKVNKNKSTLVEDSLSDISSDSLPTETSPNIEDVPIQRPKRNKHKKSSNTNKITNTKVHRVLYNDTNN